jgi:hypothetical protein
MGGGVSACLNVEGTWSINYWWMVSGLEAVILSK